MEDLTGDIGIVVGDLAPAFMPVIGRHLHEADRLIGEGLQSFDFHISPSAIRL
jgi:hypothetical protein